jgi:hypothetical protein
MNSGDECTALRPGCHPTEALREHLEAMLEYKEYLALLLKQVHC